jgi:hypothetical protein
MSYRGDLLKAGISQRQIDNLGTMIANAGQVYYLDGANGSDNNNGKTPQTAFATLATGEAALTANQNDVLVYLQSETSISIATTITWDKDYTHFVGVCPATTVANRARIFNSGSTGNSPLLTISAKGCHFENFYIFQGSSAADTRCVDVTGGRNVFKDIHFAGIGHATAGADIPACSVKCNGAEENLFLNCTFGVDTIVRAAANSQLLFDGGALRNTFKGCKFISYSETAGALMVKWADSTACDRWTLFEDCLFYNFSANHANTLTEAFSLPATNATFDVILKGDCLLVGIDEWDSNDRGNLWIGCAAPTAATSGIAVEPAD